MRTFLRNPAAEATYLWKAEEVMGQNVAKLLSPRKDYKKDIVEVIGKVSSGESWSGPYPALRKDGVVINTVVTDTPIVDDNNKIIGIIGVSFDVSSLPIQKEPTIRRSQSDGVVSENERETLSPTGSDGGKNMLSWRRVHLEDESNTEEKLSDPKLNASGSSNFLVNNHDNCLRPLPPKEVLRLFLVS
jgi:PAS domain S-box-containing protein